MIIDKNGKMSFVSNSCQELIEIFENEPHIGKSWIDLWNEETRSEVIKAFEEALEGKTGYFEGFNSKEMRTPKWYGVMISPIFDAQKEITNLLAISRDITERKSMEIKNQEQEDYYRSLLYSLHEDILVINKDHIITDINNSALKTLGLARDEVIGKFCYEISHKETSPCDKMGEKCSLMKVFNDGITCNDHHLHKRKDGSTIHVDILMSPMFDSEGNVNSVIEATRDVTDLYDTYEALNSSKTEVNALFDNTMNPIFVMERNGNLIELNEAAKKFFECSSERAIQMNIIDFVVDETSMLEKMKSLKPDSTITFEKTFMINGSEKILILNLLPLNVNNSIQFYGIGQEITDLKRKEEQIESVKNTLDTILNRSPFPMWVSDRNGMLVRTNGSLLSSLNISEDKILNKYNIFKDKNLIKEGMMPKVKKVYKKLEYTRFKLPWKSERSGIEYSEEKNMYLDVSMFPILDQNGKLKNVVCQWVDISNLMQIENELKQREIFLTSLLNTIPTPVFYKDQFCRYESCNPQFSKFFGISEEELKGKTDFNIHPPHLAEFYKDKDEELLKNGGEMTYESSIKNNEGIVKDVIIHKAVFRDFEDDIKGLIGVILDITDLKLAIGETKKQKDRAELYLDILSHDLGNIHQGLEGSLELMSLVIDDREKLEKTLNIARQSVYNSIYLTKEIMLLSKIDTEEPDISEIDLEDIINRSFETIIRIFPEKDIEIERDLNVKKMKGEFLVMEIFTNLLHNAVRLQGDKAWVRVESRIENDKIVIRVSDKGPGVSFQMKKVLFRKLINKTVLTRTGIGLTIVKSLVERYNGTINIADRIEGDHSKGALFVIRFPY